ncbi:hypothetical protein PtB15_8B235 [Puccinia triticina]|nr:hypothetical protein PtB15_8B235 [Puccinia triticina]
MSRRPHDPQKGWAFVHDKALNHAAMRSISRGLPTNPDARVPPARQPDQRLDDRDFDALPTSKNSCRSPPKKMTPWRSLRAQWAPHAPLRGAFCGSPQPDAYKATFENHPMGVHWRRHHSAHVLRLSDAGVVATPLDVALVAPSTILTPPDPQCPSAQEAARLSPSSQSRFTTIRLEALWKRCPNGKPDKKDTERLRILVYINYLITFRRPHKLAADSLAHRLGLDKDSPAIVDGILSRSTETINQTDGSLTHNLTSFSTIKLINDIFLNVGCKMSKLTLAEFEALGQGPISMDPK